jgi:hypothetical protein
VKVWNLHDSLIISNIDLAKVQWLNLSSVIRAIFNFENQDSSVGIATGYGLDDRGVRVRVPVVLIFFLPHVVQTGSGAHPASSPVGTGVSFRGVKWPGLQADHSPPTSAEIKNTWIYTSTPPYIFMV